MNMQQNIKNLYICLNMCIQIDKKQLETLNTNKSNVSPYTPNVCRRQFALT